MYLARFSYDVLTRGTGGAALQFEVELSSLET
jgi:hypothetical protein